MSSKLMDAVAAVSPAPWLVSIEAPVSSDAPEAEAAPAPVVPAAVEDAAPLRSRIRELEGEIADLRARVLPAEKRTSHGEGFAEGAAREAEKWSAALDHAAKSAAALAREKPRLRREVEADAVKLALAVARKILRRELAVDPEAILGLVRVALEKVSAQDVLAIRVAASDAGALAAKIRGLNLPERVQLVPDPALAPGSVLVDTSQGWIDASLDSQFAEIERGLADALGR